MEFQDRRAFHNEVEPAWVRRVRQKTLEGYHAFIRDKHAEAEKLMGQAAGMAEASGYTLPPGELGGG